MMTYDVCALREKFKYDPATGEFFYRKNPRPNVNKEARADHLLVRGYYFVAFNNKKLLAHRVAIAIVEGQWPVGQIDHINGVRTDNRYANLRVVTQSQNNGNARINSRNSTGYKGVSREKNGGYRATICLHGNRMALGYFPTAEEAAETYRRASLKYFGEYSYFAREAV